MDDLPPLFFDPTWDKKWLPNIPATGYAIAGTKTRRITFPTDIFGCFGIQDTGLNCCCAHAFCGPCIYSSAMKYAGIKGAVAAAGATFVAQQIPDSNGGGSDLAKGIAGAAATWLRATVRINLISKFYPEGASEGIGQAACYHTCCFSCAWCQEVNAVMVWSQETKQKPLFYGPVSACKCGELVDGNGRLVYQAKIVEYAPAEGLMERV